MAKTYNITEGNIFKTLFRLALPIMGTSFVQVAYNLTDMIWVGKIGPNSVAAVGTAGFFAWLGSAITLMPKIGAEVGVAQSVGRDDMPEAKVYIKHSFQMTIGLALIYTLILIIFRKPLISFFKLGDQNIINDAISYLVIISFGLIFSFLNPIFTAIFNGYGETRVPFMINSIGLVVNIILDPLLILGLGPFPRLEVSGAALATSIAQACVTIVFIIKARRTPKLFSKLKLFEAPDMMYIKHITRLGLPASLQSGIFSIIAMFIARIIARWGSIPIAVQKIGSQIEAISWLTAGGFQTAMSTFVGQNYGAKKWDRVIKGYRSGMVIMSIIGIFISLFLILEARFLFLIFINEEQTIRLGIDYLQILGLSEIFVCWESTSAGSFNGLGKTIPPSITGIVLNALRIPVSLILSSTSLGLNGVWWAMSISSMLKGVILSVWFIITLKRYPKIKKVRELRV